MSNCNRTFILLAAACFTAALAACTQNTSGTAGASPAASSTASSASSSGVPTSAAPAQSADAAAAKAAVQGFYDWYGPFTNAPDNKEDVSAVLRDRKDSFDPALAAALAADAAAKAKADGEEVGIDYDPFVNAQDTCGKQQRFEVGAVTQTGTTATVEVYAICDGKKEDKPRVLVSLSSGNGKWVFSDFGTVDDPHQLSKALRENAASGAGDSSASVGGGPSPASLGGKASATGQPLTKAQYGAIYNDCVKAAGEMNNGVVDDCTGKESDAANREIAQRYKAIHDSYAGFDARKAAQFEKAQQAWMHSRDAACALEGGPGIETCLTDKNVDRAIELRGMAP